MLWGTEAYVASPLGQAGAALGGRCIQLSLSSFFPSCPFCKGKRGFSLKRFAQLQGLGDLL